MSATDASSARRIASASAAKARPCAPAPRVILRPRTRSSAITGQGLADPNGVIVPRSYPVACLATWASGMDRRLTPSSRRSFGQEMARSPGTSTNRKSSSPRRTTSVLTTSAGATPRARAASAKLRTGPCRITRWDRPTASAASSAGVDTVQYPAPADTPAWHSLPLGGGPASGPSAPGGCRPSRPRRREPSRPGDTHLTAVNVQWPVRRCLLHVNRPDDVALPRLPAASVGVAALLTGAYKPAPGERVAAIITGANMTPAQLYD